MDIAAPPSPYKLSMGVSVEYYMSVIKMPCDKVAAAVVSRAASNHVRRAAYASLAFSTIFSVAAIISGITIVYTHMVFVKLLLALFLLLIAGIALLALSRALRLYRISSGLLELSLAIESGVVEEGLYCNKTLYQAYTGYTAKSQ